MQHGGNDGGLIGPHSSIPLALSSSRDVTTSFLLSSSSFAVDTMHKDAEREGRPQGAQLEGRPRYHQSWATPSAPSPFRLCYLVSCILPSLCESMLARLVGGPGVSASGRTELLDVPHQMLPLKQNGGGKGSRVRHRPLDPLCGRPVALSLTVQCRRLIICFEESGEVVQDAVCCDSIRGIGAACA